MTKLNIEYLNINSLEPYARNSRTHSENQILQISQSITEFGFTNPILIDAKNEIIAGHGRVLAAKHLGMNEIPCIRLEELTDIQKRAYVIADNKMAENAGWDKEILKLELHALEEFGFDLKMTGFDPSELSEFMFDDPVDEDKYGDDELNFIIQYNVIFDDKEQQDKWFQLIKNLKTKYPDAETIGQRLIQYIEDTNYGES